MNAVRVETTIECDGELHLKQLPCRRGDKVEAIVLLVEPASPEQIAAMDEARENAREAAIQAFLEMARNSPFRLTGPLPSREELYGG